MTFSVIIITCSRSLLLVSFTVGIWGYPKKTDARDVTYTTTEVKATVLDSDGNNYYGLAVLSGLRLPKCLDSHTVFKK